MARVDEAAGGEERGVAAGHGKSAPGHLPDERFQVSGGLY